MVSTPPVADVRESAAGAARTGLRPEIQGLRAIAVMLVVLYHLWPKRLTGGYVGVDVFFAISGFLITAHLLREAQRTGRVALAQFWARRARRLLPASLLVLLASAAATVLWVPPALWEQFLREAGAAALYVLNWVLAFDAVDYLAAENVASPSQHYWSLSVEEQFYLVWPLLVLLAVVLAARAHRNRLGAVAVVLGAVTVASLVWSVHETATNPASAYFVTPARAWQFGAGALLAVLTASRWGGSALERAPHARAALSWAGLAAIAWSGLTFTSATPFPGTAALVPVLGTVAVIAAGSPAVAWSPVRLLAPRPVQVLGDISYSTYLWHWPPIVILPYALGHELDAVTKVGLLVVVVVLAWATKRWVEDPVRSTHRFGLRRPAVTFGWMLVAMALVVAVAAAGTVSARGQQRAAVQQEQQIAEQEVECFGAASMDPERPQCPTPELAGMVVPDPDRVSGDFAGYSSCWADPDDPVLHTCAFPKGGGSPDVPHVALVGDSHARQWLTAFIALADEGRLTFDTYLKSSCSFSTTPPDRNSDTFSAACADWRADLERTLVAKAGQYDAVVTSAFSQQRIEPTDDEHQARVDGFVQAWEPVLAAGLPVVAIRDNPIPGKDPNECLRKAPAGGVDTCAIPRSKAMRVPDALPEAVERSGDLAGTVELTDFFCDEKTCPVVIGGANVYRDRHHVTATYVGTLAPYLWERLEPQIAALDARRPTAP